MDKFNDLIKKASHFVEKQKGVWDHSSWLAFLSDAEKVGGTMNEEMQRYLGAVTESMKRFYEHSADRGKKMTDNVSDQAAEFVDKSRGKWEHLEWEKFVKDIQQKGADITENNRTYLGGILESAKKFYHSWPKGVEVEAEEETVVAKEPELAEEIAEPKPAVKAKSVRKLAVKKVTRAKLPKKEGAASAKKPAKKAQPTKSASATKSKSVKSASPKKKAAAKPALKKSAGRGKTKAATAKSASPKKGAAKSSTTTKPAAKKAVKSKAAPVTKKK